MSLPNERIEALAYYEQAQIVALMENRWREAEAHLGRSCWLEEGAAILVGSRDEMDDKEESAEPAQLLAEAPTIAPPCRRTPCWICGGDGSP